LTFNKGSLLLIDYTAKVKDSNEIFDTTIEEEAKKHSLHDPNVKYQPRVVSIGEPSFPVLKGLDEALAKTKAGDKLTVEVTPDKGFGERDSGKVRMIPLRKLGEDADKVSVGDSIEIDGKKGIIRLIGSGRVQIDYNHRYAGKTILYDVDVKKSLENDEDKILEILKYRLPVEESKVSFKKTGNSLDITVPEEIFRIEGLQGMKYIIQMDIFKFASSLEKINFTETHTKQQTKPTEEKTESKHEKPVEQKTS